MWDELSNISICSEDKFVDCSNIIIFWGKNETLHKTWLFHTLIFSQKITVFSELVRLWNYVRSLLIRNLFLILGIALYLR